LRCGAAIPPSKPGNGIEMDSDEQSHGSWITPRRFAALLAILVCVSWPGILLGLQTFIYRDFGFYFMPIARYLRECFWHGQLPLWNPLNYCGEPFLAQWNTQVLYPPALFYLLLPLPWSLNVFCLLHLFLAGLGMFFLGRDWTRNDFAAALAGVVFAFSGLTMGSLLWPSIISGLAWMPWVVRYAIRGWRDGGRILVIAAVFGALQMLSGGVEVVLLTWVLIGVLGAAEFISGNTPRATMLARFVIILLLVSGLCAAQLLPFYDLLRHSQRQGNYFTADSPIPSTGWANFIIPLSGCDPQNGIYFQSGQYWIMSYYTGIITVTLAVLATWRRPRVQIWLPGVLSVICVVLAMGDATPLYPWLRTHVGIVGVVRFPVKFLILPVFVLPLMAAFALSEKPGAAGQNTTRPGKTWLILWLATLALVAACFFWLPSAHGDRAATFSNELVRVILFTAIVAGLFVIDRTARPKLRNLLQVLVLLLAWLDLVHQVPQPPTIRPSVFQPNMTRTLPAPQFGKSRAAISASLFDELTLASLPDAVQNFLSRRFSMYCNCNLFDDIPKCDGFFPMTLKEQDMFNRDLNEPTLDFLGVSEILVVHAGVLAWSPRTTYMAFLTGGQKPIFAGETATLASIADPHFNPRTEVYLPLEAQDALSGVTAGSVQISMEKLSAREIEANVDASTNTMLVAAQSYFHDWRAYVDGNSTTLWRANYGFQALGIPVGTHQVRLVYVDWSFRAGAFISLVTLAGMLAFYFLGPHPKKI
jgi:hypothetical protein